MPIAGGRPTIHGVAAPRKRLPTNVPGSFYVDSSCIDCGTCRWMAPRSFDHDAATDASKVYCQPEGDEETLAALRALVSCPVAAIGTEERHDVRGVAQSFPIEIADGVFHCGYHSEKSFGAASYLVVRQGGNVLVDSPRYSERLARSMDELGGVATMFLTHRDDVADHARFRERFGCERVMHERDVTASTRGVERMLHGDEIVGEGDLCFVPTPGHTAGSACLLYAGKFLFSGDHVAFDLRRDRIYAFRGACWFDWHVQIESMHKVAELQFEHLLPGHGAPCRFAPGEMEARMRRCVEWMRGVA